MIWTAEYEHMINGKNGSCCICNWHHLSWTTDVIPSGNSCAANDNNTQVLQCSLISSFQGHANTLVLVLQTGKLWRGWGGKPTNHSKCTLEPPQGGHLESVSSFPCSLNHALWSQARCNDFPCNKRLCIDGITDALKTKSVFNNKMILDITDTFSLESFYLMIKNFMLIKC